MAASWTLTDHSGWTALTGKALRRLIQADGQSAILAEIRLSGEFWAHDEPGQEGGRHEVVPDFEIALPQFILKESALRGLLRQLDAWLEDFDAGRAEPEGFETELSVVTGQQLSIRVGGNEGWVVSPGQVGCQVRCAAQRLRGAEVRFVADQSCLRLFRDDLQKLLLAC